MNRCVYGVVSKWEKKYGYDYDAFVLNPMLRQKAQEFNDKATKYCRGDMMVKKQTRFDKMKKK